MSSEVLQLAADGDAAVAAGPESSPKTVRQQVAKAISENELRG